MLGDTLDSRHRIRSQHFIFIILYDSTAQSSLQYTHIYHYLDRRISSSIQILGHHMEQEVALRREHSTSA